MTHVKKKKNSDFQFDDPIYKFFLNFFFFTNPVNQGYFNILNPLLFWMNINSKLQGYDVFNKIFKKPKYILAPMVYINYKDIFIYLNLLIL